MPDAHTHDKVNFLVLPFIAAGVWSSTQDAGAVVLVSVAHVIGTSLLSPDLDLTHSEAEERWGPLHWLWWPYGKAIKHRSILSHSGISVILRVAYLIAALEVLGILLASLRVIQLETINAAVIQWIEMHKHTAIAILAGLLTSDVCHTLTDHISTAIKVARHGGDHWKTIRQHHQ